MSNYHFDNFLMLIKSAGFITQGMVNSKNALNFAYALYLRLREDKGLSEGERKRIVKRWFVMSMLTGRHSGSFESTWEQDIRRFGEMGVANYVKQVEDAELSDAFWAVALPAAGATNVSPPLACFTRHPPYETTPEWDSRTSPFESRKQHYCDAHLHPQGR